MIGWLTLSVIFSFLIVLDASTSHLTLRSWRVSSRVSKWIRIGALPYFSCGSISSWSPRAACTGHQPWVVFQSQHHMATNQSWQPQILAAQQPLQNPDTLLNWCQRWQSSMVHFASLLSVSKKPEGLWIEAAKTLHVCQLNNQWATAQEWTLLHEQADQSLRRQHLTRRVKSHPCSSLDTAQSTLGTSA